MLRMNGKFFIDQDLLRYQLYEYYILEEYDELFQNFSVKQQIEGNFLDLEDALQNAVLYGLLTPYDIYLTNSKELILLNEGKAQEIICSYDEEITEKMYSLTRAFLQNGVSFKKRHIKK